MKKMIGFIVLLTMILLVATKSLYVEWNELYIIMGSLSVISIMVNQQLNGIGSVLGRSALIGFLFCWGFGLLDLLLDHFMYYLPTENGAERPLTLGFKIQEYSDDLFVGSVITMAFVMFISLFITRLLSKIIPKSA